METPITVEDNGPKGSEGISYVRNPDGSLNKNLISDVPIAAYKFTEDSINNLKRGYEESGIEDVPVEAILIAEGLGDGSIRDKTFMALNSAAYKLMANNSIPRIQNGNVTKTAVSLLTHENLKMGSIPINSVIFNRAKGASEPEYIRSRNMMVDEANRILQIFDTEFRIPNFPPMEKRPTL